MSEHYRVVVQLVHVKSETDQPVLLEESLPGTQNPVRAEQLYDLVRKVAALIRSGF